MGKRTEPAWGWKDWVALPVVAAWVASLVVIGTGLEWIAPVSTAVKR